MDLQAVEFPLPAGSCDAGVVVAALGDREVLAACVGVDPGADDAEVVAAAHARWGRGTADRLTGAFAFALRVPGSDTVRLARDVTGQIPLYYAVVPGGVVAGTDLAAIAAHPDVPADIDREALAHLYAHAHRPWLRRTGLRGVAKVPPGHVVEIGRGGVSEHRYWFPERIVTDTATPAGQQLDRLDAALRSAVRDCVRGHDHVGVHLSGGLDSGLVAGIAVGLTDCVRQAYSWAPCYDLVPPQAVDERKRVTALAEHLALPVRFSPLSWKQPTVADDWDPVLQPRLSLLREGEVQRDADERGITLLLSGWGGDEGLSVETLPLARDRVRRGVQVLRHRRAPDGADRIVAAWQSQWPGVAREVRRAFREYRAPGTPAERQVRRLLLGHVPARNESWFASAAHRGIRYGFPLQDRRLLDLVLAAPASLHQIPGWNRVLVRRLAGRHLPGDWVWQRGLKSQDVQNRWQPGVARPSGTPVDDLLDLRERAQGD